MHSAVHAEFPSAMCWQLRTAVAREGVQQDPCVPSSQYYPSQLCMHLSGEREGSQEANFGPMFCMSPCAPWLEHCRTTTAPRYLLWVGETLHVHRICLIEKMFWLKGNTVGNFISLSIFLIGQLSHPYPNSCLSKPPDALFYFMSIKELKSQEVRTRRSVSPT